MSRFISQQGLEPIKEESASGIAILMVERSENLVQDRRGPLLFVNLISCQGLDWFEVETFVLGDFFKRQCPFTTAALCRHSSPSFVREKVLEGDKQIRSQPPFLSARCLEIATFQPARKEVLGQIFRFLYWN